MKSVFQFLLFHGIAIFLLACKPSVNVETKTNSSDSAEIEYDSTLAFKLGADQYGMKKYTMAFLKPGPNRTLDSIAIATLMRAHLDNINRLADEGKLILAGPFLDGGEWSGIYIFNVPDLSEAKTLTESDPAVKAGYFIMELHPWYGSAATMMINDWHKKVQKSKI